MIRSFCTMGAALLITLLGTQWATAQGVVIGNNQNQVAGVLVDTDGTVRVRQTEEASDLAAQRLRVRAAQGMKDQKLAYISLPRLFEQVQAAAREGKPVSDEIRYLSGLTQLRYVFVFPAEKDLVVAGPCEPVDTASKSQPIGKLTGRPVIQFDDLVVMMRLAQAAPGNKVMQPFGCSIDPAEDSMQKSGQVMREYATATRAQRMKAMKEALGPQQIRLFGAPADTRVALVALAADYRLKRTCLGLESPPVPGIGSAVDNSRSASNRFWFEASYAPLRVSPEGDAFEIRGPRLVVKCGAFSFDERGATETAKAFARRFSEKLPQIAATVPAYAELQNVSDLALLAALIRHDRLDARVGLNLSALSAYKPAVYLTPRTAETLVNFTNGSIVAGGVSLDLATSVAKVERETDSKEALKPLRARPTENNWVLQPK